jgi:predicted O-methyltransferase YrrM
LRKRGPANSEQREDGPFVGIDVIALTRSYPKLSMLARRARATFTGRPYFFNRQRLRLRVFREINRLIAFDNYVETGTYLGLTTHFFASKAKSRGASVFSCEINSEYYRIAQRTVGGMSNVSLHHGDSVDFLRSLSAQVLAAVNFVYLDAHWYKYLPLRDELSIISKWPNTVVMIDDFKVPFDKDFGWDKYDDEREICLRYIADSIGSSAVYFPNYAAAEEGVDIARGYCIISTSQRYAAMLDEIQLLQRVEMSR